MTAKSIKIKNLKTSSEKGFTLIELLVVIGILAILMGIVLIAINPARQFNQANNTSRRNSATQILNAIGQYEADHHGTLPGTLAAPTAATEIAGPAGAGKIDLCTPLVVTTQYIPSFPEDPEVGTGAPITDCTSYDSGFTVAVDASGRVTIAAPNAKLGEVISVTR